MTMTPTTESWIEYTGFPEGTFSFNTATWSLIIIWLLIPIVFYSVLAKITYILNTRNKLNKNAKGIVVAVLGDLGHSPRMSYHVKSLVKLGYYVDLCGYLESDLPEYLYDDDVTINEIKVVKNTHRLPYLLFGVLKVVKQSWDLFSLLKDVVDMNTKYILIQNPPSLPLLAIVILVQRLFHTQAKLIIDWHNLNYTVLNMKYNNLDHPVIKIMKKYEQFLSKRYAYLNLTVSEEMRNFLIQEFKLNARRVSTLYDRPSDIFQPLESQDELKLVIKDNSEIFQTPRVYDQQKDRVLVSSSSFTEDEDFGVLIDALVELDKKLTKLGIDSQVWMIVTGKGPLHSDFLKLVDSHEWNKVTVKSIWLPIEEYPRILKIADMGISLHYSTSGLDLPMKIVDFFGSGVPVITLSFKTISELVKQGKNGFIMKDNHNGQEMSDKINKVLFEDRKLYLKLKEGALKESQIRWDNEWDTKLMAEFELD